MRFFSVAQKANWRSIFKDGDNLVRLSLEISSSALQRCDISEVEIAEDAKIGTVVELCPLKEPFDWLTSEEARASFNVIFAPYILQYPDVKIFYDGHQLDPKATINRSHEFPQISLICPTRNVKLSLRVIEWRVDVGSRKIHFGGESGVVLGSQPANVIAPEFSFSAYAYSPFFQEIADAQLLDLEGLNDPNFNFTVEWIRDQLGDYFRKRQAERSSGLIQELINAGVYPYEGDPKDEVERREREVFDIATHAVSSYSREFKKADNSLKRITLGLLREAVRHNPESVTNILKAVIKLPKNRQDEFSNLLNKTEPGNIISASSLIAERIITLQVLRGIVFDPKHKHTIKERGELDVLVRDNTWIFGENFHITLSEAGLTRIMDRVADELSITRSPKKARKPDGKTGRIDTFLGRLVPHTDSNHREFLAHRIHQSWLG